jgi:hypothetical protein
MNDIDVNLDKTIEATLEYLNKNEIKPDGWSIQINVVKSNEIKIIIVKGIVGNVIDGLVKFSRRNIWRNNLKSIFVIAEDVDGFIVIYGSDVNHCINIAKLEYYSGQWRESEKIYSENQGSISNQERHPAYLCMEKILNTPWYMKF